MMKIWMKAYLVFFIKRLTELDESHFLLKGQNYDTINIYTNLFKISISESYRKSLKVNAETADNHFRKLVTERVIGLDNDFNSL